MEHDKGVQRVHHDIRRIEPSTTQLQQQLDRLDEQQAALARRMITLVDGVFLDFAGLASGVGRDDAEKLGAALFLARGHVAIREQRAEH